MLVLRNNSYAMLCYAILYYAMLCYVANDENTDGDECELGRLIAILKTIFIHCSFR